MTLQFSGLYAFLDSHDEGLAHDLLRPVARGGCGARVLQVRIKARPNDPTPPATTRELVAAARMARAVCSEYGALCIINDHLDVALAIDADGVHLGQRDLSLADAQAIVAKIGLGRPFIVGITANVPAQVEAAVRDGADYIGFGPVFPTKTKLDADPARGLEGLREAVSVAGEVSVVAIGGLTPAHAPDIAATGARAACCISSVNHAPDRIAAGIAVGVAFEGPGA